MGEISPLMHIDGALGFLAFCLCLASFVSFGAAHQCYQVGQDKSGRFGAIVALLLLAAAVASGMGAILTFTPAP